MLRADMVQPAKVQTDAKQ